MRDSRRSILLGLLLLGVGAMLHLTARGAEPAVPTTSFRVDAATAHRDHVPVLPARVRAATFRFAPGTAPADRDAFLAAVTDARPPARRLVDLVDGLVDVRIGSTGQARAIGLTESAGDRLTVTVDLATVAARYGRRGIDRVVLHELGHVVDFALLPQDVRGRLDAAIPVGYGCDEGVSGACAEEAERFAESFAKWATGDIGADLYIGYKVLPPSPTLDAWGVPLADLGRGR